MPTITHLPLQTVTLGSNDSSITFTNIPATDINGNNIKDLVIYMHGAITATHYLFLRLNGDSGSNYQNVALAAYEGDVETHGAGTYTWHYMHWVGLVANQITTHRVDIFDIKETNKHKMIRSTSSGPERADTVGSRWNSTAAITSVQILGTTASMAAGTKIDLYGVIG